MLFLLGLAGLAVLVVTLSRIIEWMQTHRQRDGSGLGTVLTSLLVIANMLLVAVTAIQGWAFIQSERASIAPVRIRIVPVPLAPGRLVIEADIQNAGRQTATVSSSVIGWSIDTKLPAQPDYGSDTVFHAIILPNVIRTIGVFAKNSDGSPVVLTNEQIQAINNGQISLRIYGRIIYGDQFSRIFGDQTIGYCDVYTPTNTPPVGMFNECGDPQYTYAR